MSITRPNPFEKAGDASKLSAAQLQQAIKAGTVPPYIGIPLLQEKVKMEKQMMAAAAAQQPKPPTVADQVMAEASQFQGVPSLQTNLPVTMAGGGIVAFAEGDLVDDEDSYDDRVDQARADELNDLMEQYAGLGALAKVMPEGKTKITSVEVSDGKGGLHPELESRVAELRAGYREKFGKDLPITSGFRTREDQERLYAQRGSNPNLVAKPGHSKHEHGLAVDMPAHIPEEFLRQYGLHRPHGRKDPVHVEMMAHGGKVSYFGDPNKNPEQDQEVKDEEKRRLERLAGKTIGTLTPAVESTAGIASVVPEIATATFPSGTTAARAMGTLGTGAGVVGAVPMVGQAITGKAGRDLATYTTPEQRRALSSNALLSAQSGDAGIAAAIMDAKRNNPEGPSKSSYLDQMGNALGFIGNTLVGKPGYGVSRFNSDNLNRPDTKAYEKEDMEAGKGADAAADAYKALLNKNKKNTIAPAVPALNQDKIDAADNARIDKMLASTGVKPSGPAAEQGAKEPSELDQFKDLFAKREAGMASQREQDKYLALLSAGLGIMGGTSHNAFANIGQGAQLGIQSLAQSNAARTAEQNALLSGRLGLAKIGAAERQALAAQQLRKELQEGTLAYQKGALADRLAARAQEQAAAKDTKTGKLVADIEDKVRAGVAKDIAANAKLTYDPNVDSIRERMVQDRLRAHKTYGKLYESYYGSPAFEDTGAGAGGGTRIKFDKQGNMIP